MDEDRMKDEEESRKKLAEMKAENERRKRERQAKQEERRRKLEEEQKSSSSESEYASADDTTPINVDQIENQAEDTLTNEKTVTIEQNKPKSNRSSGPLPVPNFEENEKSSNLNP